MKTSNQPWSLKSVLYNAFEDLINSLWKFVERRQKRFLYLNTNKV